MSADRAQAHFEALFGPEFGHGRAFDLQPLRDALAALGDPQERLAPIVHIAGTNGKGSTLAFLRAVAEAADKRLHAFTKPHLIALNERFHLAGAPVEDDALIAAADRVKATGADISQFEAQVAAAFLLFAETPADFVLLETGFGGRDDATNVIAHPALTLLAPIDLDHQAVLGETRAAIAAHKAGIIKPSAPALSARQHEDVVPVLEAAAARAHTPLLLCGRDWDAFVRHGRLVVQTEERLLDLPLPALIGPHQIDNAGLAALAALMLGYDAETIATGIVAARWPGRLQPLTRGPLAAPILAQGGELWIDGGHNPHAAAALAHALQTLDRARPRANIAIVGLRARKDGPAFIDALAPALAALIAIPLDGDSFVDPDLLAARARSHSVEATTAPDLAAAIARAAQTPNARVLICGSLLLAGQALATT